MKPKSGGRHEKWSESRHFSSLFSSKIGPPRIRGEGGGKIQLWPGEVEEFFRRSLQFFFLQSWPSSSFWIGCENSFFELGFSLFPLHGYNTHALYLLLLIENMSTVFNAMLVDWEPDFFQVFFPFFKSFLISFAHLLACPWCQFGREWEEQVWLDLWSPQKAAASI